MLPISSTLLDKVKEKMQTIGNNANPQMEIIAQKAARYLNQGSFLTPRTVRTGNDLGPLDICIRRETRNQEPTEIVMAYIENGLAKVATLPYVSKPTQNFVYQYTIGPGDDVACDFDGRWNYITDHSGMYFDMSNVWEMTTFGEPYIAVINNNQLIMYQGQNSLGLVINDVVKVSMLRGWKSVNHVLTDQGLLCAYIKTDGLVYYRGYCEQEDGSFIWENEQNVAELGSNVDNISLFRAADYRTGFLVESAGAIKIILTDRCWSGMATPPDNLELSNIMVSAEIVNISYLTTRQEDLYLNASEITIDAWNMSILPAELLDVYNVDDGTGNYGIKLVYVFDQIIRNANEYPELFKIEGAYGLTWYGQISEVNGRSVTVTFNDFNNAGNLPTARVLETGLSNGYTPVLELSKTFTAINLVPTFVPSPVVTDISNLDSETIVIEFDLDIEDIASQSGFAVTGQEPAYSPGDSLINTAYVVDSISYADPYEAGANVDFSSGVLTNMEVI